MSEKKAKKIEKIEDIEDGRWRLLIETLQAIYGELETLNRILNIMKG